jgi:N-hydroxyarylamine O-acetyltransferase
MMNRIEYLRRLRLEHSELKPDSESLKLLQRQHLLTIPYENLDIHWKRPIVLDTDRFYEKIVGQKRGGFCYELNGLYYELLKDIGFQCRMISARVNNGEGFGAEYDHLAILVRIEGSEYLTDVGFGNFIAEPVRFVPHTEQTDPTGVYRFGKYDDEYLEIAKKSEDGWKNEFIFKNLSREFGEFQGMCDFHQTSPESHFTKGKICSLMTENGRKTLTDKKFIETVNGVKTETGVDSEAEFGELLEKEFGIRK